MIRFTNHALQALKTRSIPRQCVIYTIEAPDRFEPDPRDPRRVSSWRRIEIFEDRMLGVVHRPSGADTIVITVHFDRGPRR